VHRVPSLLLIVSALAFADPRIENAVAIHTTTRDYLEFDIAPWSCGLQTPMVELELRRPHVVAVHWKVLSMVDDTICPIPPVRLDMLLAFPDSSGGPKGALDIDTVLDSPGFYIADLPVDSAHHGVAGVGFPGERILTPIAKVRNPPDPVMCPMVRCAAPDSVQALQGVLARIRSSSLVGAFSQVHRESLVAVSPWTQTTGAEDFPEVVAPLGGNAHNWIDRAVVPLALDSLVTGGVPPINCGNGVCFYPPPTSVDLPIGPVRYVYQQPTDPFRGIAEGTDELFQVDSVMKVGPGLLLSGFVQRRCGVPLVDSELSQESRWLVASDGSTADSLEASFRLPGFCEFSRPGAWPLRDGRVEIAHGIWISLQELLPTTAIGLRPGKSAEPSLVRAGVALELELPAPAVVRAVDLSGREVLPAVEFASGRHALHLPASRSLMFVQVRIGMSTTTLPVETVR
jgi:hypothetical protein